MLLSTDLTGTHAYCKADVGLGFVGGVDVVCWACAGGADGHRISRVYLNAIIILDWRENSRKIHRKRNLG